MISLFAHIENISIVQLYILIKTVIIYNSITLK